VAMNYSFDPTTFALMRLDRKFADIAVRSKEYATGLTDTATHRAPQKKITPLK